MVAIFDLRIPSLLENQLVWQPSLSAVRAAGLEQIDVAVVVQITLSTFAEHQEIPVRCHDQRWNSIGVVAALATDEHFDERGHRLARTEKLLQEYT